ncbi:MAG TPA: bacillithiol biosynthesis cysteine-adding enzyme BshC [Candidatus Hydrogenedentes bacterium]|nr:bacillithiol biosynthesis cysteine-adding enzyme BshC [Candidatus Hydrogenedentota bacterium]
MPDIFNDYLSGNTALSAFYTYAPQDLFSLPLSPTQWPNGVAEEVRQFQKRIGSTAFLEGSEPVIVTGQQPGLLTGPLYTIHKAVTAILLARRVSETTGTGCLPVFWIGADDHDFEEVRSANLLTRQHESRTLRYDPEESVHGFPMYKIPLSASLHVLIDEASRQAPGSEFSSEVAAFLHESLDASDSLADWFGRIMARLFQNTPLLLFAPYLPAARRAAIPVLEKEIREPLLSTRIANETGERLRQLGYEPQVVKNETECGFFLEMGEFRRKVLFENNRFHLPEEEISCTTDEMLTLLHAAPERFSPNVLLRCPVRRAVLPVAAYVAGPGEIGYWGQTKALFDATGYPMPVVYPRARCVLATPKLNKLLNKLGLAAAGLFAPEDDLLERALRTQTRHPALPPLTQHRTRIEKELHSLRTDLSALRLKDQTESMTKSASEQITAALDRLERAILRADETQNEATRKQVHRLIAALAPDRKPQERHYTVFSFLFEHGWELIPRLLDSINIDSFQIQEIEL